MIGRFSAIVWLVATLVFFHSFVGETDSSGQTIVLLETGFSWLVFAVIPLSLGYSAGREVGNDQG